MMEIRYVDNHLLVVEKSPGMLSQGDETGDPDMLTLLKSWVGERFNKPGNVYLGLVHRLDRPASGLMVFARTSKAAARLSSQFAGHHVEKRYLAWVQGQPPSTGSWTDHLAKMDQQVRVVEAGHPAGKKARLRFDTVAQLEDTALMAVTLQTGRAHQVRVQFASRGFPLIGDFRYGATQELDGRNLALHAAALAVDHPTLKERMGWTSVPGAHWPEALRSMAEAWCSGWVKTSTFGVNPDFL